MLSKGRLVAIGGASVIVIALFNWIILPFLFPPVYHASNVTVEERNVIETSFYLDGGEIEGFVPSRLFDKRYRWVRMRVGWGHLSVGVESYKYIFAYFEVRIYLAKIRIGPKAPKYSIYYLVDFFSNSSELGELFRGYGLPHTYVKASYRHFSEGSTNRTRLSMTYPDERPIIELSAVTPKLGKISPYDLNARNLYHLDEKNLTIFHMPQINSFSIEGGSSIDSHANITFAENSAPWRYVGRTSYVTGKDVYTFPLILIEGKIGWIRWG